MEAALYHAQRLVFILAVLKYWGCGIRVNYSKTLYIDRDT